MITLSKTSDHRCNDKDDEAVTKSKDIKTEIELESSTNGGLVLRKLRLRVLPLIFLSSYLFFTSRAQVGFTAEGIMRDLNIDAQELGYAISAYFIPYALFQLPFSLLARKLGMRRSLTTMLIAQGLVSMLTSAVKNFVSLLCIRAVLGIIMSAYNPMVTWYLSSFFGRDKMSGALAISFILGGQLSSIIPASALVLYLASKTELMAEWKLYYIFWGMPSVLLAFPIFLLIPDTLEETKTFLTEVEHQWLQGCVKVNERERQNRSSNLQVNDTENSVKVFMKLISDSRIVLLALINFTSAASIGGLFQWQPQLISNHGRHGMAMSALLNAIPGAIALPISIANARHSDFTRERIKHAIVGEIIVLIGFGLSVFVLYMQRPSTAIVILTLCLVTVGDYIFITPFLAYATDILPSKSSTAGIAIVTIGGSVGNISGPAIVGSLLKQSNGTFILPLLVLLCLVSLTLLFIGTLLCIIRYRKNLVNIDEAASIEEDACTAAL